MSTLTVELPEALIAELGASPNAPKPATFSMPRPEGYTYYPALRAA